MTDIIAIIARFLENLLESEILTRGATAWTKTALGIILSSIFGSTIS